MHEVAIMALGRNSDLSVLLCSATDQSHNRGGQAMPDPLVVALYGAFAVILAQTRIIWLLLIRQ